ncbi:MAG: UDP-3-O-(3-hydroxymyristoyl)glucosamine N-acyltransferase, partial [Planctomycetota bacterium]
MPDHDADAQLSIAAGELADLLGGTLEGPGDTILTGIAPIESGGPGDLTFIRTQQFAKLWDDSRCSAALVSDGVEITDNQRAIIRVPDADIAFATILDRIDPGIQTPPAGAHPSSTVDPCASVHPAARIGPNCTVATGSSVGPDAVLIAGVYVGAQARIGEGTVLHPGVVIGDRCRIGRNTIVHPNAVIGSDGFGFIPPTEDQPAIRIPQIGDVEIGEDCEIGAGSTVDRAKLGTTRLGDRVKLDNLVHIGHNVTIGDDSILCGRVTVGGSVTIGKRVMCGGSVTFSDQITIGDNARIAGGTVSMDDIPAGETYLGMPAMPARAGMANYAAFKTLSEFTRRTDKAIARIQKTLDQDG